MTEIGYYLLSTALRSFVTLYSFVPIFCRLLTVKSLSFMFVTLFSPIALASSTFLAKCFVNR